MSDFKDDVVIPAGPLDELATRGWFDGHIGATYWLKFGEDPWRAVLKEEWVRAERAAGFNNTMGHPEEPGTAGFGLTRVDSGLEVRGRIVERYTKPEHYNFDPEFRKAAFG